MGDNFDELGNGVLRGLFGLIFGDLQCRLLMRDGYIVINVLGELGQILVDHLVRHRILDVSFEKGRGVRLFHTILPTAWNNSNPPSRHCNPANLDQQLL